MTSHPVITTPDGVSIEQVRHEHGIDFVIDAGQLRTTVRARCEPRLIEWYATTDYGRPVVARALAAALEMAADACRAMRR